MADQRIRELLRELERMGVRLVERPDAATCVALREAASWARATWRHGTGAQPLEGEARAVLIEGWLATIGEPVGRPFKQSGGVRCGKLVNGSRCTLTVNHQASECVIG